MANQSNQPKSGKGGKQAAPAAKAPAKQPAEDQMSAQEKAQAEQKVKRWVVTAGFIVGEGGRTYQHGDTVTLKDMAQETIDRFIAANSLEPYQG